MEVVKERKMIIKLNSNKKKRKPNKTKKWLNMRARFNVKGTELGRNVSHVMENWLGQKKKMKRELGRMAKKIEIGNGCAQMKWQLGLWKWW